MLEIFEGQYFCVLEGQSFRIGNIGNQCARAWRYFRGYFLCVNVAKITPTQNFQFFVESEFLIYFCYFVCIILVILCSLSCVSVFHVWSLYLDYIILISAKMLVPLITLLSFRVLS